MLLAVSLASLFAGLTSGTFPISAQQVIDSVIFPAQGVVHDVIWRLRATRGAAAFACGGLLALAGALLLRRIPSEPRVLGISCVAAAGSLLIVVACGGAALMHAAESPNAGGLLLFAGTALAALAAARAVQDMGVAERRWLLPLAALLGGSLITLADTAARALSVREVPVGVLAGLLGLAVMPVLLQKRDAPP